MKRGMQLVRVWVLVGALLVCTTMARATTLSVTDPSPVYATSGPSATVTAYTPVLLTNGPSSAYYIAAFNSWNSSLALTDQWTVVTGGTLNATLQIDIYRAYLTNNVFGGVELNILYTPGTNDPPRIGDDGNSTANTNEAVWTQVIYTDKKLGGSLPGNPYLDNHIGSGGFPPPLYPFQYTNSSMYDSPLRETSAFWYAEAYLSKADYSTRTITIYDGVAWGFTIVPEPSSFFLVVIGAAGLWVIRRRR